MHRLMTVAVMLAGISIGCSTVQESMTTADFHYERTSNHLFTNGPQYAEFPGPKQGDGTFFRARSGDVRQGQSEAGIAVAQELGGVAKVFLLVEGAVEIFKSLVGMSAVTTSPTGGVRAVGPAAAEVVK